MTTDVASKDAVRLTRLQDRVIGDLLVRKADERGDAVFATVAGGGPISAGDLLDRARRAAGGFRRLGVEKGDLVALMMVNREEYLVAWFGLALIGAVEVPMNTWLKGRMLHHVLSDSRSGVLVVEANFVGEVANLDLPLPALRATVVVGAVGDVSPAISWEELVSGPPVDPVSVEPSDPASVMYTSGTTGQAKGVICSHAYMVCWADDTDRAVHLTAGDTIYTPLPLYHITGQAVNVLGALLVGAHVVVDTNFSAKNFWTRMAHIGATHVWSFGLMTPLLYREPESSDDRNHDVRVLWSIPWPTSYGGEFERRFGVRILGGYGSTEQGLTLVQPYDGARPDAVGRPSPYYEVGIVDERGRRVDAGEVGEFVIRPREPASTMLGYLHRPDDTVEAFRDLWYHTGDRAQEVGDGFVRFVDRKDDAIRRRGENISAWEIEAVVGSHPSISECAVIGVPSELGEQDVKVVAVLASPLDPLALFNYCSERLAYFMVPRYIEFVDVLPKTPSLRVQKYLLRQDGITEGTWDCELSGIRLRRPGATVDI